MFVYPLNILLKDIYISVSSILVKYIMLNVEDTICTTYVQKMTNRSDKQFNCKY